MRLHAGEKLAHYEILGELGAGGMGEVFRAHDSRLGREVAIKILPEQLSSDPGALKNFKREAKALAALSHPNIVTLHDFDADGDIPYVVMELLKGTTLRKAMAKSPLSWRETAELGAAVANGLSAAHSIGVIHRDLKPENIFLSVERNVKILDFGLARFNPTTSSQDQTSAPTESRITEAGIVKGTLPYMSPEQVRGNVLDARSDIFSLGSVLYEMLSRHRTFEKPSAVDTMASILTEEPPDLIESGNAIPHELSRIVHRCLQKDPEQRFQTARDLAFALQEVSETSRVESVRPIKPRHWSKAWLLPACLAVLAAAVLTIGLNVGGLRERVSGKSVRDSIRSIAVLPLDNLSGDPKQEYFADGMTEELITSLSRIESLHVISRTSVMEYKKARKPLPQIAKELNVDAILEGSVMQIGNQVKITAQLIHASSDRHLWAQTYQRNISDVFALQNEVASAIADQIRIQLTPQEHALFAKARPVQPDAYEAYLRGVDFMARPDRSEESFRQGAQLFQRAVEIDPGFAIAYAELARSHSWIYAWYDHTPERLAMAKAAIDRAFQLQPGLPEAHHALGNYYYFGFYDYDKALKEYSAAQKDLPRNALLLSNLAAVSRRQGKLQEAVEYCKKALQSSPRDSGMTSDLAGTYTGLRKYSEADHYYDLAISLAPDEPGMYEEKANNYFLWKGDTKGARAILERSPIQIGRDGFSFLFLLELFERNYDAAIKNATAWQDKVTGTTATAWVYHLKNDRLKAAVMVEPALSYWVNLLKTKSDPQEESLNRVFLGFAYALANRKADALREGKKAIELWPVSRDAMLGTFVLWRAVQINLLTGENEAAMDQIEYLLSIPSDLSVNWLRFDPLMDPLRSNPRFQKLLSRNN